jgi:hypothetical protein
MPEFIKNIGRFFENHVEKIVLAIVGALCAVLFFKYVIFSPNTVTVGSKKYAPGQVDQAISEQAKDLQQVLKGNRSGDAKGPKYTSVLTGRLDPNNAVVAGIVERPLPQGFMGLFRSPLSFVTDQASIVPPARTVVTSDRRYKLPPRIGAVTDVAVNYIRDAAWVPTEPLTSQRGYDKVEVEANDVDLVTVEAKFDTAELYHQFRAYFNGEEVAKSQWRDATLAEPVFAAVQLQRRTLSDNGAWSDWQDVPRCRAETNAELFRVADLLADPSPGSVEVHLTQFRRPGIVMDLLQPEPYQIASAEDDWFPPSFYEKYRNLQKKVDLEAKREEREKNRDLQQARDDGGRYRNTTGPGGTGGQATGPGGRYRNTTGSGGAGDMSGGAGGGLRDRGRIRGAQNPQDGMYGPGAGTDPTLRRRGTTAKTRTRGQDETMPYDGGMYPGAGATLAKASTNEVYRDFSEVLINYRTKLGELDKPLLFWAFDDTVQPGGTYQYRMRLGVFNPVVGTNQLVEQDMGKKDQVILWSDFSGVAGPVAIPQKMYFFAKDVQVPKNSATVEVARYLLGYWRSEDFEVKPGEVIGREMKPKKTEDKRRPGELGGRITDPGLAYNGPLGMGPEMGGDFYMPSATTQATTQPEMIDYRTGKVLIDVVQVNDWSDAPNLRPRTYHEMLYTADGQIIEHMPVSTTYWSKDLLTQYQFVSTEAKKEQQEFRPFKKGSFRSRGAQGMMDGLYPGGGMYPDMMMNDTGGGGPYR